MAYDSVLADRVRGAIARTKAITEKKMFGGVGFLLHGNMCVGIWKDCLIARVGAKAYPAALDELGAREFDITGRPMNGWVMVDSEGTQTDDRLRSWIERSLAFVKTLPRKQ